MKRADPVMLGVSGFFFLAGAVMIWFAVTQFQGTDAFLDNAVETDGRVIKNPISCTTRYERSRGSSATGSGINVGREERVCTYRPTIEFMGPRNDPARKQTRYGRGSYDFAEGEEIRILVNADYDYVLLAEEQNQNEVALVLLIFGSLLWLPMVGVAFVLLRSRRKRS